MKTYTEEQEAKFVEVLREIQREIHHDLLKAAVISKKATPTVEKVLREAVKSKTIDPEKRQQIQNLLDTGDYSREKPQEVAKYTKLIDQFVNRKIREAIKAGRLPPKSHIKFLPSIMKIANEK